MHGPTVALRTQQRTTTIKRPWSPVVSTLVERHMINSLIHLCLFNIETRKHYYLRSHSALGDPAPGLPWNTPKVSGESPEDRVK